MVLNNFGENVYVFIVFLVFLVFLVWRTLELASGVEESSRPEIPEIPEILKKHMVLSVFLQKPNVLLVFLV